MYSPWSFPSQAAALGFFGLWLVIIKAVVNSRNAKLSHIPGPFWARYTDLWRFLQARRLFNMHVQDFDGQLTRAYGDVVRIGPKAVVFFDPSLIPLIYGTGSRLDKGEGYMAFAAPGVTTALLSIRDEELHAKYRRPVNHAYSLSAQKLYEPNVDKMASVLIAALNKKAETKETANISEWCHFYVYDVVGQLTFGQPLGFLETGQDVYKMLETQKAATYYAATMSQLPWLDRFLKNTATVHRQGSGAFLKFVGATVQKRLQSMPKLGPDEPKPDLLSQFASVQDRYPDIITARQITIMCAGNLFAGSQSPSYVLDTICKFLATSPHAQETLHAELTKAQCTYPLSWEQSQNLPYLEGIVREGYRLHHIGFFVLERVVPSGGLKLPSGQFLPAGTKIGTTSGAPGFRESVYGADAHEFKPERWLCKNNESQKEFSSRRKIMEQSDMTFGYGSRNCLGKSIANMEIYKVVGTLVGLFEFELLEKPTPFVVNVKVRKRRS